MSALSERAARAKRLVSAASGGRGKASVAKALVSGRAGPGNGPVPYFGFEEAECVRLLEALGYRAWAAPSPPDKWVFAVKD